nr:PREDICTED: coiled-coil domain-containing protein 69 [Struthio camelus australis]
MVVPQGFTAVAISPLPTTIPPSTSTATTCRKQGVGIFPPVQKAVEPRLSVSSRPGWRQLKPQQPKGTASKELTALKTENAHATPWPGDGKEKAIWLEEQRTEIAKILQGHEEEKERLRQVHQAETQRLAQDVKIQVEKGKDLELKEQLSELFNALKREHEGTLQELRRAHDQEKLLLTESHQRSQEALQETIDALNSQLKSFQEKMKRVEESLLSRDYKKHIEVQGNTGLGTPSGLVLAGSLTSISLARTAGPLEQERGGATGSGHSPSAPSELVCIATGSWGRTEPVTGAPGLPLTLALSWPHQVEQNLLLEEKVKTLQQENEDLHVRTQNHLIMTR